MNSIQLCIDRIVPHRPKPTKPGRRIAAERAKLWKPGQTIRVRFLDGAAIQKSKVESIAHRWEQYANIRFQFTPDPAAEIRISFAESGSWSSIGTDALHPYFNGKPTMNYGWLKPDTRDEEYSRVVLHEFGHALGAVHEHQNPAGGIEWNKEAVYEYFTGEPNNWTKTDIDRNVLERYSKDITNFTEFDPESIMLYDYPATLTLNGASTHSNRKLSAKDKAFMRQQYP